MKYRRGGRDMVVTIGRQFGSGGRAIGEKLAQKLGVAFYDKELISLAAKESGLSPEVFDSVDEKAANSLLYTLALSIIQSDISASLPTLHFTGLNIIGICKFKIFFKTHSVVIGIANQSTACSLFMLAAFS